MKRWKDAVGDAVYIARLHRYRVNIEARETDGAPPLRVEFRTTHGSFIGGGQ